MSSSVIEFIKEHAFVITAVASTIVIGTVLLVLPKTTTISQNNNNNNSNNGNTTGQTLSGSLHNSTGVNGTLSTSTSTSSSTSTHTSVGTSTIVLNTGTSTNTALSVPTQVGLVNGVATVSTPTVVLSWPVVANSTGYKIYNGSIVLNSAPVTSNTFTATGLLDYSTYTFYVSAVNAAGEGLKSSGCTVTTFVKPTWKVNFLTNEPSANNKTIASAGQYNAMGVLWINFPTVTRDWQITVSGKNSSGLATLTTAEAQGGNNSGNTSDCGIVYEVDADINSYTRSSPTSRTVLLRYQTTTQWLDNMRIGVINSTLPSIYTKSIWVRFYDVSFNQNIFCSHSPFYNTNTAVHHRIYLNGGLLYASQGYYNSPSVAIGDPSVPIVVNQWYFIAVSVSGTNVSTYLYNSGNTAALASGSPNIQSATNFVLMDNSSDVLNGCEIGFLGSGGNANGSANAIYDYNTVGAGVRGFLDKPSVYPIALTGAQVYSLFASEKALL